MFELIYYIYLQVNLWAYFSGSCVIVCAHDCRAAQRLRIKGYIPGREAISNRLKINSRHSSGLQVLGYGLYGFEQ